MGHDFGKWEIGDRGLGIGGWGSGCGNGKGNGGNFIRWGSWRSQFDLDYGNRWIAFEDRPLLLDKRPIL